MEAWDGITVEDLRAERAGRISFTVGPRRKLTVSSGGPSIQAEIGPIDYPDSYASPIRFIDDARQAFRDPAAPSDPARLEWYCFACSFRPWADTGRPDRAWLTVVRADGTQERLRAQWRGDRFVVSRPLKRKERAYVAAGDVTDAFGNVNGQPSADVKGARLTHDQGGRAFPGVLASPSRGTLLRMGRKPFRLQETPFEVVHSRSDAHPRAARLAIDQLNGHIDPALKDDVRLLVSEVVTNSVIHAQPHSPGEVALDVWASEEVVRVAVTDRGPGFVAAELPPGGQSSGWGLMMVDRLAHRWGVELDDGTEVWFEFQQGASGGRAAYAEPALP